jgi:hypothetical protein
MLLFMIVMSVFLHLKCLQLKTFFFVNDSLEQCETVLFMAFCSDKTNICG